MFQFSGFPSYDYVFTIGCWSIAPTGCPIRTSTNRYLFAAPRGFSQLVASFVGSWCQGILPALFLTWPKLSDLFVFQSQNLFFTCLTLFQISQLPLIFFSCLFYHLLFQYYSVFKVQCQWHFSASFGRIVVPFGILKILFCFIEHLCIEHLERP